MSLDYIIIYIHKMGGASTIKIVIERSDLLYVK